MNSFFLIESRHIELPWRIRKLGRRRRIYHSHYNYHNRELFECRCPQKNPQLIYFYYYIYLNNNEQKGYSSPPSPSSRAPLQILPRQGCWRQCCRLGSATLQRAPSASSGLICYVISSSSFSFSSPFFPLLPSALHFSRGWRCPLPDAHAFSRAATCAGPLWSLSPGSPSPVRSIAEHLLLGNSENSLDQENNVNEVGGRWRRANEWRSRGSWT